MEGEQAGLAVSTHWQPLPRQAWATPQPAPESTLTCCRRLFLRGGLRCVFMLRHDVGQLLQQARIAPPLARRAADGRSALGQRPRARLGLLALVLLRQQPPQQAACIAAAAAACWGRGGVGQSQGWLGRSSVLILAVALAVGWCRRRRLPALPLGGRRAAALVRGGGRRRRQADAVGVGGGGEAQQVAHRCHRGQVHGGWQGAEHRLGGGHATQRAGGRVVQHLPNCHHILAPTPAGVMGRAARVGGGRCAGLSSARWPSRSGAWQQ